MWDDLTSFFSLKNSIFSDYRAVEIDDFITNLRGMHVPRFAKPKEDESGHEAEKKFMRSLPGEKEQVYL